MPLFDLKPLMDVKVVKVICICFNILPEFHTTGIPFIYCSNINELKDAIENYNRYRIILVCAAEHVEQLNEHINSRLIRKVFIYGNCTQTTIRKEEVTIVDANEQKLMSLIITSVINYIHDEVIQEKEVGNKRKADELATNIRQLLELIEQILHQNDS